MKTVLQYVFRALILTLVCTVVPVSIKAQGTTHYVYDDNGRLRAVISPSGEAAVYEYDLAGNFTEIRRLAAGAQELFSFSPHQGVPGDLVTFLGVGFGFGAGVSAVSFNGAPSPNVTFTPSTVVAEVPAGATTGLVTITTPKGSVTTPVPFTIRGIRVSPSVVSKLLPGESAQFAATVVLEGDQSLKWSVNEIEGGNASVGTISTSGLYVAPKPSLSEPSVMFYVRAMSVAAPDVFGEAQVTVLNPEFIRVVLAPSVSVRNGNVTSVSPLSMAVSVRNGNLTNITPLSAGVSVTTGPHITSISPTQVARGATVSVTINGANLSGATNLRFIDANGVLDTNIIASNIAVNGDGTSLTATLNVSGSAALGQRVVIISTTNGRSLTVNAGPNTIQVVQ